MGRMHDLRKNKFGLRNDPEQALGKRSIGHNDFCHGSKGSMTIVTKTSIGERQYLRPWEMET
jgi:hypothetical protein